MRGGADEGVRLASTHAAEVWGTGVKHDGQPTAGGAELQESAPQAKRFVARLTE